MKPMHKRVRDLETQAARRATALPPRPLLQAPVDVVSLLAEQAEAVRQVADADPLDRARTLSVIAGLALRAMEAAHGAARVEALERALKAREAQEREAERAKRQPPRHR